jgi:hypothetical protein
MRQNRNKTERGNENSRRWRRKDDEKCRPDIKQKRGGILSRGKKLNSVAFSPHANYTDRATVACRRS